MHITNDQKALEAVSVLKELGYSKEQCALYLRQLRESPEDYDLNSMWSETETAE